ncbi:polysaccharide pyruvyl transferase family protein [Rhodoferax sp.]|uniref:polysaccharide pyruvyl transferase family protein n=1 Tax=Rhodoferax sp. TaxID=50421 RepID=UPI002621E2A5|nr:polysaccharide pyruvyl transferase family protein [Rhodoferax sp.]MDD2808406.1 polysaccharide pyruvyl transferase family protein [Rhodoferax sp.]MDD4942912.1 polysaccharide pyruvyl transferase family protein [Rhodoferax sp.]
MTENKNTNSIRVGFFWQTLTSENLGVGALAQSQLSIARTAAERAGVRISCIEFCPTGPNLKLANELKCDIADPLSPRKILLGKSKYITQIRGCDLALDIGAGDSFSDIYGMKHFFFLSLSKFIALLLGKPLILSPQTIGPFKSRIAVIASNYLIRNSNKVFARDGLSMAYLIAAGHSTNTQEVIDVAFRLPYEKKIASNSIATKVGINVSGLLLNGGYTKNNQFGLTVDYPVLIDRLIAYFQSLPNTEVHLVAHVIARTLPVEDDYAAIIELGRKYPSAIIAPEFQSPSEAKSYISGLDFFTGARMHACIGAYSSGVAVVPMAYSRKFNGLFNSLGYTAIADLIKDSTDEAYSKIVSGFDDRVKLKQLVEVGNLKAIQKIQGYEDYLVEVFKKLLELKRQGK